MRSIEEFPVQVTLTVGYVDMGMFNHVNNANYFRYFENARAEYFDQVGLSELYSQSGIGAILGEVKCKFIRPLAYPDNLVVGARIKSVGETSLIIEYIIHSEKQGVAAIGEGVLVMYDYGMSKRTKVPAVLAANIQALEGQVVQKS